MECLLFTVWFEKRFPEGGLKTQIREREAGYEEERDGVGVRGADV